MTALLLSLMMMTLNINLLMMSLSHRIIGIGLQVIELRLVMAVAMLRQVFTKSISSDLVNNFAPFPGDYGQRPVIASRYVSNS